MNVSSEWSFAHNSQVWLELSSHWWVLLITILVMGTILLWFMYRFRRRMNRLHQLVLKLYDLQREQRGDLLDFLWHLNDYLNAEEIEGVWYCVDWYGVETTQFFGNLTANQEQIVYATDEVKLNMKIYTPYLQGDQMIAMNLLREVLGQVIKTVMLEKQSHVDQSKNLLRQYDMFMQHDLKNLAQYFQLIQGQLDQPHLDAEAFKTSMKTIFPHLSFRADRILKQSKMAMTFEDALPEIIELKEMIENLASRVQLNINVNKALNIHSHAVAVEEIFNNLVWNCKQHLPSDYEVSLELTHVQPRQVACRLYIDKETPEYWPTERMFEPFWSNSEHGLGLGLYLSKQLALKIGGDLHFRQTESQAVFEVLLVDEIPSS